MATENEQLAGRIALYAGGAFIGYQFLIRPLLEGLGLKKDQTDIDNQQFQLDDVWDINWYKKLPPGAKLMKMAEVNDLIDRLWDATGFFNDDEQAIYGAIRQPRTKSQIAQLNYYFLSAKNKSLIDYLDEYLNSDEMAKVREIVDQKPRGY